MTLSNYFNSKTLNQALIITPTFLIFAGCASVPPQMHTVSKPKLQKNCIITQKTTTSIEDSKETFNEEEIEQQKIIGTREQYIGFDKECAKQQLNELRNDIAFKIIAQRAAFETRDPTAERTFSDRILTGLNSKFPRIRQLSEAAIHDAKITSLNLIRGNVNSWFNTVINSPHKEEKQIAKQYLLDTYSGQKYEKLGNIGRIAVENSLKEHKLTIDFLKPKEFFLSCTKSSNSTKCHIVQTGP